MTRSGGNSLLIFIELNPAPEWVHCSLHRYLYCSTSWTGVTYLSRRGWPFRVACSHFSYAGLCTRLPVLACDFVPLTCHRFSWERKSLANLCHSGTLCELGASFSALVSTLNSPMRSSIRLPPYTHTHTHPSPKSFSLAAEKRPCLHSSSPAWLIPPLISLPKCQHTGCFIGHF